MSLSLNARQLSTLHVPTIINYSFITNIYDIGMMLLNVVTYVDSLLDYSYWHGLQFCLESNLHNLVCCC